MDIIEIPDEQIFTRYEKHIAVARSLVADEIFTVAFGHAEADSREMHRLIVTMRDGQFFTYHTGAIDTIIDAIGNRDSFGFVLDANPSLAAEVIVVNAAAVKALELHDAVPDDRRDSAFRPRLELKSENASKIIVSHAQAYTLTESGRVYFLDINAEERNLRWRRTITALGKNYPDSSAARRVQDGGCEATPEALLERVLRSFGGDYPALLRQRVLPKAQAQPAAGRARPAGAGGLGTMEAAY